MSNKKKKSRAARAQEAKKISAAGQTAPAKQKKPPAKPVVYKASEPKSGKGGKIKSGDFFKIYGVWIFVVVVALAGIISTALLSGGTDDTVSGSDTSGTNASYSDTSGTDISNDSGDVADEETLSLPWPVDDYSSLIPSPPSQHRLIEYNLKTEEGSDTVTGFHMIVTDLTAEEMVSYLDAFSICGFEVEGPDENYLNNGISLYTASSSRVKLVLCYAGGGCDIVATII